MSKVQRVPRPLLGLLGIVGEQPPQELTNEYHGSIEMLPMIVSEVALQAEFVNNATAAQGGTAIVTVPEGQVWFVDGVQYTVTLDGTVPVNARVSCRWDGGFLDASAFIANVTYPASAASTMGGGYNAARGQPIIARAGSVFSARVDSLVGAANISLTIGVFSRRIAV
jgi:hypothetical protein